MEDKNKRQTITGGFVGRGRDIKIVNCHAEGKIIANGENDVIGAFVGEGENIEIKDSINNMDIITNSENVFAELKREVAQIDELEKQKELLSLIEKMEISKGTKSFREHYNNFISKSADYMTLLVPFLPKLTEFIQ